MSLEAAAALICKLGCLTDEEQSRARAKVPTDRATTRNWSISRSESPCSGVHDKTSSSSIFRPSDAPFRLEGTQCYEKCMQSKKYYILPGFKSGVGSA